MIEGLTRADKLMNAIEVLMEAQSLMRRAKSARHILTGDRREKYVNHLADALLAFNHAIRCVEDECEIDAPEQ